MTPKQASSIEQLLRASSDDESVLTMPLPDSTFGNLAQQAVEKLYKVLLQHHLGTFPFSHDLKSLRNRVEAAGVRLPVCPFQLERLTEYAAEARYADPIPIPEQERATLRACIAQLRSFVLHETSNRLP